MSIGDKVIAFYMFLGFVSGLAVVFYWAECMPKQGKDGE